MDAARFNACFDSHKYKADVDKDIKEGNEAGVTGTPAFFINGRMLSGAQPFDEFKRIIDEELALKEDTEVRRCVRCEHATSKRQHLDQAEVSDGRQRRRGDGRTVAARQPTAMSMWSPRSRVIGLRNADVK